MTHHYAIKDIRYQKSNKRLERSSSFAAVMTMSRLRHRNTVNDSLAPVHSKPIQA